MWGRARPLLVGLELAPSQARTCGDDPLSSTGGHGTLFRGLLMRWAALWIKRPERSAESLGRRLSAYTRGLSASRQVGRQRVLSRFASVHLGLKYVPLGVGGEAAGLARAVEVDEDADVLGGG